MHLLAVAAQWVFCTAPDQYGVEPPPPLGGPAPRDGPGLRAAVAGLTGVLSVHLVLAAACCAALVTAELRRAPKASPSFEPLLLALKVAHLAASLAALRELPRLFAWTVFYAAIGAVHSCYLSALSFRTALALLACALAAVAAAPAVTGVAFTEPFLLKLVPYVVAALLVPRQADRTFRAQWRMRRVLAAELRLLQGRLRDLFPREIADRQAQAAAGGDGGHVVYERRTAAVLQLDVCGFTAMSRCAQPFSRRSAAFFVAPPTRRALERVPSSSPSFSGAQCCHCTGTTHSCS